MAPVSGPDDPHHPNQEHPMTGSTTHLPARLRAGRGRIAARALTATLLAATTALAACGSDSDDTAKTPAASTPATTATQSSGTVIAKDDANSGKTITLGSKNFTEQKVLGEVYAEALEAAGYTVKREFNLGDEKTALKALKGGQIDAYPEYTGTALGSFFNVSGDKLPHEAQAAYELVKTDFEKDGIAALPPTPFTDSNEVAVTEATAKKYNLTNISDLASVASKLKIYGSPECRSRNDCLKGLQDTYGLKFKSFTPVDLSLRHEVLTSGKADVSIVFTTDPQIARDKLVLLKDDKQLFPPYNSTVLIEKKTLIDLGDGFAKTIALVNTKLDANVVQELNAKVDLDKKTPEDAAKSYLSDFGFVQ
jgi:osmoprotectant transport system substrate-binding protein